MTRIVSTALAATLICVLALSVVAGKASAATVTAGWSSLTVRFDRSETADIMNGLAAGSNIEIAVLGARYGAGDLTTGFIGDELQSGASQAADSGNCLGISAYWLTLWEPDIFTYSGGGCS